VELAAVVFCLKYPSIRIFTVRFVKLSVLRTAKFPPQRQLELLKGKAFVCGANGGDGAGGDHVRTVDSIDAIASGCPITTALAATMVIVTS